MAIETVFLDAGGVLVYPNWYRVSDTLCRHGVQVPAAVLRAAEPHAKKRIDCGETIQATNDQQRGWTYFNLVLERAGVELDGRTDAALAELHEYHRQHNLWETVGDEVRPALTVLRSSGCRLVVVSNANGTLHKAFTRLGIHGAFDAVFDSCDEGVEKPDPRFFTLALTRTGSDPASTVHVGDLYHVDVVGARSAGLRAILVDEADLYRDCDCPRVRSIAGLPAVIGVRSRFSNSTIEI